MAAESTVTAFASTLRSRTHVMSCDATVVATFGPDTFDAVDAAAIVTAAIDRLHALEARWSRFRPTSEVSRLNSAPTVAHVVSDDTIRLVDHLLHGWRATDGAFDPTLLGAIIHLGYDASRDAAGSISPLASWNGLRGRPDAIVVDRVHRTVRLGTGTSIDPGGLGKGLAADIVSAEMIAGGATGALVEVGGDLRVRGVAPAGDGWPIDITDRGHILLVADGGVATSTTRRRTWTIEGVSRHHLVDPGTLRSTDSAVEVCTVVANSAAWAEAFTKIAFVRGASHALAEYESLGLAASIVTSDGALETSSWNGFRR